MKVFKCIKNKSPKKVLLLGDFFSFQKVAKIFISCYTDYL